MGQRSAELDPEALREWLGVFRLVQQRSILGMIVLAVWQAVLALSESASKLMTWVVVALWAFDVGAALVALAGEYVVSKKIQALR